MKKYNFICTACGAIANPIRITKGSIFIEIGLWIFFIIPGVIYSIWRLTTKYPACPNCKNATMIPITSPFGRKLSLEQTKPLTSEQTELKINPHLKGDTDQIRDLASNYINKMTSKKP